MTDREGYRITIATPQPGGGCTYSPMPGDDRIFTTWREAHEAVQRHRAAGRNAAMQAVQLDDDGAVVWPPPGRETSSRGHWNLAPIVRVARRVTMPGQKPRGDKPGTPSGRRPRRRKYDLDPRVAARIAEIRRKDPGFGRVAGAGEIRLPGGE